jgi:hypothetical protein
MLDEQKLARVLRESVPEPPPQADRPERVRRVAGRIRLRRRAGVVGAAAAVALAIMLPLGLIGSGPSYRHPPVAGGPTSAPPTPPDQHAFCASANCVPQNVLQAIRRPLHLPSVAPGAACPTSPVRRFPAGAGFSGPFRATGPGPLYVAWLTGPNGTIRLSDRQDGWFHQKVIWVVSGDYPGPLLLHGGRVDGPGQLQFIHYLGAAGPPGNGPHGHGFRRLLYVRDGLHATAQHVTESFPSGISLTSPGCYAIQVDGEGFSETLVFRAVR